MYSVLWCRLQLGHTTRMGLLLTLLASCLWLTVLGQQSTLIWEDNFDTFDPSKWEHEVNAAGGGNGEFQVYVPDTTNTFVQDGKLHIRPTLLKDNINPQTGQPFGEQFLWTGIMNIWDLYGKCSAAWNGGCYRNKGNIPPIASGRIRTKDRFSFTYGRIEIRAKMPSGDWMWPAIWMLPENDVYGGWPNSGEIDIVEVMANRDLRYTSGGMAGQQKMLSSLHWGPSKDENKHYKTAATKFNHTHTFSNVFHDFVVEWSADGFRYFVDGAQYLDIPNPHINKNPGWNGFWEFGKPWKTNNNPWAGRSKMAPFDQKFHFLLNVAVGGTGGFFPDNVINHGGRHPKPWKNWMSWREAKDNYYGALHSWLWSWRENNAMQVDHIRVYKM